MPSLEQRRPVLGKAVLIVGVAHLGAPGLGFMRDARERDAPHGVRDDAGEEKCDNLHGCVPVALAFATPMSFAQIIAPIAAKTAA